MVELKTTLSNRYFFNPDNVEVIELRPNAIHIACVSTAELMKFNIPDTITKKSALRFIQDVARGRNK